MGFFSLFFKKVNYVSEGGLTLSDRQFVEDSWRKIDELQNLGKPSNLRQAVIEADKLTDFVLKKMYPNLSTMGERLKQVKPKFVGRYEVYDDLWFAHKVRNELVHNVNFDLPSVEAGGVINKFKGALNHLGVI